MGGTDPTSALGEIRYPDGSVTMIQGQAGNNPAGRTSVLYSRLYANAVIDPAGNATTFEYANWGSERAAARPSRIVDPLGREVRFHYNNLSQLTAITASGDAGQQRTLARLTYRAIPAYTRIHPTNPANDRMWFTFAVEGIFFPATSSGYWFGDTDSYTQYAMIRKVVEQNGMSHSSTSLTDSGTLTQGSTTRIRSYDLPMTAPSSGDRTAFPRYTTLTETINGVAAPLVTTYLVSEQPSGAVVSVRLPDGVNRLTILDDRGLPLSRSVSAADGSLVSHDEYLWSPAPGTPRLLQLTETDPLGRKRRTEYSFTPTGQLQDVKERDWVDAPQLASAPLLKWTRYAYVTDAAYVARGMSRLVRRIEVFGGSTLLPEERTDFEYDTTPTTPTPGIGRNVFATPGFLPDGAALFSPAARSRPGFVSRVNRWVEPSVQGNNAVITTESRYTQSGAISDVRVDGRILYSMQYAHTTGFAFPSSITVGQFTTRRAVTYATSTFEWNVPVGEIAVARMPSRGVVRFEYDAAHRLRAVHDSRGESRMRTYGPASFTDTYMREGTLLRAVRTDFDGRNLPTQIVTTIAGEPPIAAKFEYDIRGRLSRMVGNHVPGTPEQWSTLSYDSSGRVSSVSHSDGTTQATSFSRTGAPAQLVSTGTARRDTDGNGRNRYVVTDALGRVVQVLEPPSSGSAWLSTTYSYAARSNLLSVSTDNNRLGGAVATRRFKYDGLSRLTHRYLIERSPSLNASGALSPQGIWSDVYTYDGQSKLVRHVDPRGVVVAYNYGADPLRRLLEVNVTAPPAATGSEPIAATPRTRLFYMRSGDPLRLERVEVDGVLSERYRYDPLSRLDEIITTFSASSATPLRQSVTRDQLGRVDRFTVGLLGQPPSTLSYGYDAAGRRNRVESVDPARAFSITAEFGRTGALEGFSFASGTWRAEERFGLDPSGSRFSTQSLSIQGATVLDQTYHHDRAALQLALGLLGFAVSSHFDQLLGIEDNLAPWVSTMAYDHVGRLAGVDSGPKGPRRAFDLTALQYTYDSAGNRIGSAALRYLPTPLPTPTNPFSPLIQPVTQDLGPQAADGQIALTTNPLTNRITTPGFLYDAAGNITRLPRKDGTALRLRYDGFGRLRRVEREGSTTSEEYDYNAASKIAVTRSSAGVQTYIVRNGPSSATRFVRVSTSSPLVFESTMIALGGRKVARLSETGGSRNVEFLHTTPTGLLSTTPSLNSVASRGTAPFGSTASASGSIDQFHAYERSSFGLDYAMYRHYDPETGRFLQPDPLGESVFRLQDPQSLNLYAFVRNDPLNRRDPLGLNDCDAGGVATPTPDGGVLCSYAYGKTVFETVVHANRGDSQAILGQWMPNNAWFSGFAPWQAPNARVSDQEVQDAIDNALLKKLREMREKKERQERCAAANAQFAAAANAYARIAANVAMHNLTIEALQYSMVSTAADSLENYFEQREDISAPQGASAAMGRSAAAMSIKKQYEAAKINQALLQADQKAAVDSMKAAASARDAACR
jgi:RHS repeat-associated protein